MTVLRDQSRTPDLRTGLVRELAACRPTPAELRRSTRRLKAKAALIIGVAFLSYLGLLNTHQPVPALMISAVLTVALIATGTCVMHDANHGAFGPSKRLNAVLAYSADVLGVSSMLWREQHNTHHANTNVIGVDTDLEQMPFARLAPGQPNHARFRYQHIYLWSLYGFLTLQWVFFSDYANLATRKADSQPFPPRRDTLMLAAGKALHITWALLLPLYFHRWWTVLAVYITCSWIVGVVLAVFFQLAHCVDIAKFADPTAPRHGDDFPLHQLRTTANVRCGEPLILGRMIAWLMGGLHHQIEHHLAPGLPHTAYPTIAKRVKKVCLSHDIDYLEHPTFGAALRSHMRWLQVMGRTLSDC